MKKKNIYLISIIVFILAVGGICLKYYLAQKQNENKEYGLVPRKGRAANTLEWKDVQKQATQLQAAIKADPTDTKSILKLAQLFILEARITGNHLYYDVAAMKYVNDVLKIDPVNFNALVYKSLIYMSQHHFADGLAVAHTAQQVNPYNAYVYGLLVDGNVEMGFYDSAVTYADKMVSIRPDLTSYSRVSYLREIFGDYPGSIKAMKMAVEAGGQGDEYTEWTRYQLANLYEKTGDYKTADTLYNISLGYRPTYAYGFAGLAKVAIANHDYTKAIAYYERADSVVTDNTIREELADAYRLAGQAKKADDLENNIIADLTQAAQAGDKDINIGHYADRELAYAYLKVSDKDKALDHALLEYNRRPDNIDVNETVAWVYYERGDYAKALPYIKVALKTHSKNPVLLSRAALIYYNAGDKTTAKTIIGQVSLANAFIEPGLRAETAGMVAKL
jgi:tetratricopeptide (TPR) repeat protein